MIGLDTTFKPKFSGHETFPFRYDWLRKVLTEPLLDQKKAPEVDSPLEHAMATYGVGKNMVQSMYHWIQVIGAGSLIDGRVKTTDFGRRILVDADPYLDSMSTIWALHWRIATNERFATTWYWFFNLFPSSSINTRTAISELKIYVLAKGWKLVSDNTLRRDIECFIRCYSVSRSRKGELGEDSIECPLAELELLRPQEDTKIFEFQRGPKPSLQNEVFIFALNEFWNKVSSTSGTLSFDQIAHAAGSPGKVFRLDEDSIISRLQKISEITNGRFNWADTAGLQQVLRNGELEQGGLSLLESACKRGIQ